MADNRIRLTMPDDSVKEVKQGTTVLQAAQAIGGGLEKTAAAGLVDGCPVDLAHPLRADCRLALVAADDPQGLAVLRHSAAHLLAQAVKRLYGADRVHLGVGPVTEDGFYYDIGLEQPLSAQELAAIEREMERIVREDWPIVRHEVTRGEALLQFGADGSRDPLKLELIRGLPEDAVISLYEQGEFVDLCRGPHIPSTGRVKAFKLLGVAGAYWRGDPGNRTLQRIYGTAFPSKRELEEHIRVLEEAKKRDHRKLGRELGLFMFSDEAPGMPFFLPGGMAIRSELERLERDLLRGEGYEEVRTPILLNRRLWEQSGHWDHYHENMYFTESGDASFALKPMNCPGHMLIFGGELRSYRELPLRLFEFGQVHRHEYSGALGGMMRVRTFCQDDAHLFVRPDQIEREIEGVISLIDRMYGLFGFVYRVELSTRPEQSMGAQELWEEAEGSLRRVLENRGIAYRVNNGDGAFYGPKIDFHIRDALKRSWQCGTIQLDFQMPGKFGLSYVAEDGRKHCPVVIHRAVYGSIERFIGILTEHYGGVFPLWLAPVQVKLLPVSGADADWAFEVKRLLEAAGLRVKVDGRDGKLGAKIRDAQLEKVPYMAVVGERERLSGAVSVRKRGEGDIGTRSADEFAAQLREEIADMLR